MDYKTKIIENLRKKCSQLLVEVPPGWSTNYKLYQKILPYLEEEPNISDMSTVIKCLRKAGLKLQGEKYPFKSKILNFINSLINSDSRSDSDSDSDSHSDSDSNSNSDIDSDMYSHSDRDMKVKIYSVSDINHRVKDSIKTLFKQGIEISAEISNLSQHNGNIYLSLKDNSSRLKGIIWKSSYKHLPNIKNGDKLIVSGRLDTYHKSGEYQFIIDRISEEGIGNLKLNFEKLKKKLEKEGYFKSNSKKPIPKWITRVGIISSPNAAGFGDIIHKIRSRNKWIDIFLIPSSVQGKDSVSEMISAIDKYNKNIIPDVIVITRGGGSVEDLESYNNIDLVKKIYDSKIPIVTAIGHEKDISLCDLVSDYHAITPTAAGEKITIETYQIISILTIFKDKIRNIIDNKINNRIFKLDKFKQINCNYKNNYINNKLIKYRNNLYQIIENKINLELRKLNSFYSGFNLKYNLDIYLQRLNEYRNKFLKTLKYSILKYELLLKNNNKLINLHDPQIILNKGFCRIEINGEIIDSSEKFYNCKNNKSDIIIYFKNNESITVKL